MELSQTSTAEQYSSVTEEPGACWPAMLRQVGAAAVVSGLLWAAGYVAIHEPYRADSSLGYNLGVVGGVLMLLLYPYSLRKRLLCLRQLFTMRSWFLFHIVAGILGPLLVLFHATFRIESINGGIALGSTLLVTVSGLIGRFFYRNVYRGMAGNQDRLTQMEEALAQRVESRSPDIGETVRGYLEHAASSASTRSGRLVHFLLLGRRRSGVRRRIRNMLGEVRMPPEVRREVLDTVDETLLAAQRTAQFTTYERLFALWHVIHIPFLFLLFLTSVVHVVAVHIY